MTLRDRNVADKPTDERRTPMPDEREVAMKEQTGGSDTQCVTHGRHCICSACAAQDWSEPQLAACGMHGPSCLPRYVPLGTAGDALERLHPCPDCRELVGGECKWRCPRCLGACLTVLA